MTREDYLCQVQGRLSNRMPPQDLARVMRYYEEYFSEAGADREAEIIEQLGTPADLARQIMGEQVIRDLEVTSRPQEKKRGGMRSFWTVLLAICAAPIAIPLAIALAAVALALVVALIALVAGVGVAGAACVAVGIFVAWWGFSVLLTSGMATTMYFVGGGVLTAGLGILLAAGTLALAGVCLRGITRLLGRALRRGGAQA